VQHCRIGSLGWRWRANRLARRQQPRSKTARHQIKIINVYQRMNGVADIEAAAASEEIIMKWRKRRKWRWQ